MIIFATSQYETTNVMISLALLHSIAIIFYHFVTYTCHIDYKKQIKENCTRLKCWCVQLFIQSNGIVDDDKYRHDYEEYDFNNIE